MANSWMQYPVGMEFNPDDMRNVMNDFWALVLSPVAINKFFHSVLSGWTLAGVFVIGVSAWMLLKKRNVAMAVRSIKVAGWVGIAGILATLATGDGSAKVVSEVQPMKLAAMEGLYKGSCGQDIVGVGILNPDKQVGDDQEPYIFDISIPYGLSVLAEGDPDAFVPGVEDILAGIELTPEGDTIKGDSYAQRIERGKAAHDALRRFDVAKSQGDENAMQQARADLDKDFKYFGYGYFDSPQEAVPDIPMTFYSFHIMVILGGYFLLFYIVVLLLVYKKRNFVERNKWLHYIAIISIPLVWICSEAGWVVAEVGRQPWVIEGLMPARAAISNIPASSVIVTFTLFAVIFTGLLIAEISIMTKYISRKSQENID